MTFNAKNLSYESKEPAFLQRLRSECGAGDSNRPERPLARPKRRMVSNETEDDAPTYVDEDSQNVVSKESYDAMISKNEVEGSKQAHPAGRAEEEEEEEVARTPAFNEPTTGSMTLKEPTANIGRSTKKRLVKVIGDDGEFAQPSGETHTGCSPDNFGRTKKSKKSKKIKLSFDDVA